MKATLEKVSTLERKLNIHVPATEVQAAFHNAYQSIQKHVAIKGFRKGKAPLQTVKSIYGDRVKQDVVNDLVQKFYSSALREHALDPISFPTIEFDALDEAADFAFTAEFEVRPEVQLKQVEKLNIRREKYEPKASFVDDTIQDILKSRATPVPVLEDRPAQKGDIAIIDFKGFLTDKELENNAAEDHELELGSNMFIPGFEDGVIGMKAGAAGEIKISFPADYHVNELAGQPVTFKVTLKKLMKKDLPELNDEFAKSLGKYESVADLKKAINDDHEKREQKRIKDALKDRVVRALVEKNPVDVPKALLTEQKKSLVKDMETRMSQQGMPAEQFDEYKDKWDSDFNETASFMIRSSFLLDKIASDNNLKATDADLDAKFVEYAAQTGIELARVKEFYGDEDRKSRLRYQLTEERVIDWLLSKADVKEVSREEIEKLDAAETKN
ncbi:MAG: trigger factor [Bdellovibrionales bacterium]|nr:trigger factor [Bdellovibrionales bacterium]